MKKLKWIKYVLQVEGLFAVGTMLGGILVALIFGEDNQSFIYYSFVFVIPINIWWHRKWYKDKIKTIGITKKNRLKEYLIGILMSCSILFITGIVEYGLGYVKVEYSSSFKLNLTTILFLIVVLVGVIIQTFAEEMTYRGMLQHYLLNEYSLVFAIIVQNLVFTIPHFIPIGNLMPINIYSFTQVFTIGLLLSLISYYRKNIWISSGFHFCWNFVIFLTYENSKDSIIHIGNDSNNYVSEMIPIVGLAIGCVIVMILIIKNRKYQKERDDISTVD